MNSKHRVGFVLLGLICALGFLQAEIAGAAVAKSSTNVPAPGNKKGKIGKTTSEDFSSQVVEGQIYRPDLSVVTGDTDADSWGVIRLRKDFRDHAQFDKGEAIK